MGIVFSYLKCRGKPTQPDAEPIQPHAEPIQPHAEPTQEIRNRPPTHQSIVDVNRPPRPNYFLPSPPILHYEIAVPEDKQMILDFMIDNFLPYGPFQRVRDAFTKDDMIDIYGDIIEPCLTSQCSLLGFDGDKLLAISLNSIEFSPKDMPQLTVEELNKEYPLKKNYAKEIASGPYESEKANQMHVYLNILSRGWTRLFTPGSKLLGMDIANVAPQAKGKKISKEMGYYSIRLAAELGCTGGIVVMVAKEMKEMMAKGDVPATLIREINFKDFKVNSRPAWGKFDGSGLAYYSTFDDLGKM